MPGKNDVSLPNNNHLIIGTSGSGKSTWLKGQIKQIKPARLLVWDPDEEYQVKRFYKISDLVRFYKTSGNTKYKIGLTVDATPANFELFCKVAFAIVSSDKPVMMIIEELADVTTISKAPHWWGQLCRRGRKYGAVLFAVTQRPAECDKTIYSQAPFKWVGYLENNADRKRAADQMGVSIDMVSGLNEFDYLYKKRGAREPETGKVKKMRTR